MYRLSFLRLCSLLLLLAWAGSGILPDTLYKRNGQVLREVKIVGQTRLQVRYRKKGEDKVRYIAKSQLKRITYGKVDEDKDEEARKKARELRKKREAARRKKAAEAKRRAAARRRRAALADQERLKEAIRRDIVLPGWGQWHVDQPWKGGAFAAGFLATAGYAYVNYQSLQTATASYLDPIPFAVLQSSDNGIVLGNLIYGQRAAEVEASADRLNQSLLLLTLIWAGAFLDLSFYDGTAAAAPPTRTRRPARTKSRPSRGSGPSKGGGPSKGRGGPSKSGGPSGYNDTGIRGGFYALPPLGTRSDDRGSFGFVVQLRF